MESRSVAIETCKSGLSVKDLVSIWSSRPIRLQDWIGPHRLGPSVKHSLTAVAESMPFFHSNPKSWMCFEHLYGIVFFPGIFSHICKKKFLKMAKKDVHLGLTIAKFRFFFNFKSQLFPVVSQKYRRMHNFLIVKFG